MTCFEKTLPRRGLFAGALGVGMLLRAAPGQADAPTGLSELDVGAIPVRHPADVLLEAVVRAGTRLVAVGEHGVIIYSDDNGVSWAQAAVPVSVTFTCAAFATPMIGWAAGHFGVVVNTADGGKTWQTQLNGLQANQLTLAAAQAAAAANSTAAGAPFALRRADYFTKSGPSKPFLSMLVLGPQKLLVFGAYRMTMLTQDGGKTWTDWSLHIEDKLSHNLYDVTMLGTDIYLVAETGLVFHSTDGGGDFAQVTSPGAVSLFGVTGATDGSVVVFGIAGNAFRSTDQGKTWQTLALGTGDNLVAGLRLEAGNLLIASESGLLFKSVDNGATFHPLPGVPPAAIFGLAQAPDGGLILAGLGGAVRLPAVLINS